MTQRSWTHLSRARMAEILERNTLAFDRHTEQLQAMGKYHEARMVELSAHDARLDAHAAILGRRFWGRVRWLLTGR